MIKELLVFLGTGAGYLLSLFLAYKIGIFSEQKKVKQNEIDAIKKVSQARNRLVDPAVTDSLHEQYRR